MLAFGIHTDYILGMNAENLITLTNRYASHTGLKESTIATYAAGAGGFFKRLRDGCDITTGRASRVAQYFSDHWPLDLLWPLDIPRPDPAPDSPAVQAMADKLNLNQIENESETNPLTRLNAKGHIADPAAFCTAISFGCAVQRSSFDQVVHQYADDRPRATRNPRKGSIAADILRQLVVANDTRFTTRIDLLKKFGLGA